MKNVLFSVLLCGAMVCSVHAAPTKIIKSTGQPSRSAKPKTLLQMVTNRPVTTAAIPEKTDIASRIFQLIVTGNATLPASLVLNEIQLQPGDILTEYRLNQGMRNIKALGFFSEASSEVSDTPQGKIVRITVAENPFINAITFEGNTAYPAEVLLKNLSSKTNDLFSLENAKKDIQKLNDFYRENGYIKAMVVGFEGPKKDNSGTLHYIINEGVIGEITITGNRVTKDYVIKREMSLKPGMPLQMEAVKRDLQRIYNLNYFQDVNRSFSPGEKDKTDIQIEVQERKGNATFQLGGGLSNNQWFLFSDIYWDNVLGTGQLLSLRGQFGDKNSTSYEFKYSNPWMWDERKALTVRAWDRQGSLSLLGGQMSSDSYRTDQKRKGSDVAVSYPLLPHLNSWHTVRLEWVDAAGSASFLPYMIQSYQLNLAYDTRDVWFSPSRGVNYSFSIEKSGQVFQWKERKVLDYWKSDIDVLHFFPVVEKQTIATRMTFGGMWYAADTPSGVREDYQIGGATTVRGYQDGQPFAQGPYRVMANAEYRVIFNDMLQGVVFLDAGTASGAFRTLTDPSNYKLGKGAGVRVSTPFGPLRLDFAWGEEPVMRTHFSIGHAF